MKLRTNKYEDRDWAEAIVSEGSQGNYYYDPYSSMYLALSRSPE